MNQAGYQHYVATRSVVLHHISSSPGRKSKENENMALFLKQWEAVTKALSEKEAPIWREFHGAMEFPQFLRWVLVFQSRIRYY